jgi:hypothetical protein
MADGKRTRVEQGWVATLMGGFLPYTMTAESDRFRALAGAMRNRAGSRAIRRAPA